METVSIIKFNEMPEIRSHIFDAEILSLDSTISFKANSFCRIFVIISGSATFKVTASGKSEKGKSISSNYVLVLPPEEEIEFKISTQRCQILYITFDLLATESSQDYFKENYDHTFTYKKLRLLRECVSPANYEENFPFFLSDIHNLITHFKFSPTDLYGLSFPLETVLHTILRVQLSTTINVLRSVKAITVTSDGTQFKTPFNFSISDVSVWSHPKGGKTKSEKICAFLTQHNFTELPKDKNAFSCKFTENKGCVDEAFCEFIQTDGERFKLWMFPGMQLPSLEDYKGTGVICFRFKSSQPGNFIISLYHTPSYQRIKYTFEVEEPNVWTDFEIPISKNSALNVLLPYIEKAVQFIQDNYADKITIQDIANHVRIHPSYLSAIFRKSLNQSVNSYINFHRINVAKQLLRNSNTSITDIALQTGFYDAQHFLKTFKKNTGFTPSEYRHMG